MRIVSRAILRETAGAAVLGTTLFAFILFLQKLGSGNYFEILLRGSATLQTAGELFLMVLPPVLSFAIPIGTLVGVLIGLGRMSSDGEITALRAAGVPGRKVVFPVVAYAIVAMLGAAAASLWLTPWSIRVTTRLVNSLIAQQLTAEVQPRVFEEQFTGTDRILYVGDVISMPGPMAQWRKVFIADLRPPEQRSSGDRQMGDAPGITLASEAVAVPDPKRNSIQLSLTGVYTHEVGKEAQVYYNTHSPQSEQVLEARTPPLVSARAFVSMDTVPLMRAAADSVEAQVELHQRLALPVACVLLAMVGIPLGVSSRKSGKSAAVVLTVFLGFLYYMALISLIRLAQQGQLPPAAAVWTPNAIYALAGVILLFRLERPGDRDVLARLTGRLGWWWSRLRSRWMRGERESRSSLMIPRLRLLPGVIDTYVLSIFLFYFVVVLASFVMMAHAFIFFELLGEVISRGITADQVMTYHFFLTPKLIYDSAPWAVLVAVLVTFALLSKSNEVTAIKACGVSLYRLAAPVLAASAAISLGLFAFDHYYIPEANRIQDNILNEIKGRPAQRYLSGNWIFGADSRLYYYKYFDEARSAMLGVNVWELEPETFALKRHISAESARWEPSLDGWIFQNGWAREINDVSVAKYATFRATTFPELSEPPSYFLKEVKQEQQLNFLELRNHIEDLQQSGFDTVRLRVQYYKKFSVPVFVLIVALLAVPFSFWSGAAGAIASVGASGFGIAIAYWASSRVFEGIGNLAELPPELAAWAPDAIFALAGLYLFTRMRS